MSARWWYVVAALVAFACAPGAAAPVQDADALAQRFRPYYKFSVDNGNKQEPCRPCSWQWFAGHCGLYSGDKQLLTSAQLRGRPALILTPAEADLRTAKRPTGDLMLRPDAAARDGEPWAEVIDKGAGLYAQCEDGGGGYVVLTYWTLFGYNRTTVAGDHEGDITAVALVYHRPTDQLVRASFGIHGRVLESFDLVAPEAVAGEDLHGVRPDGRKEATPAHVLRIAAAHRYQDGPVWHSPAAPQVYLAQDPRTKRFEHLAVFHEWGAHEPWPNPKGSVTTAPKHEGDGVSFLPKRVRLLGSLDTPVREEEPFLFFNGKWGDDPMGVPFHRSCYYPEGRAKNHLKIPEKSFVDRDPFAEGTLRWPPPLAARPPHVRIAVRCEGDRKDANVTIRWGHPDFHEHEYFKGRTVARGQSAAWEFDLPDRQSEFEVQTEGGKGTGYVVTVQVDKGGGLPPEETPTLKLHHRAGIAGDEDVVNGGVGARRSGKLNEFGEQSVRVDLNGDDRGPIR